MKIKNNAWRQDKIHLDFEKSSIQLCGIEKYNTYFIAISCTISTVSFCWWQKHTGTFIQQVLNAQTKNLDWGFCPRESEVTITISVQESKNSTLSTAWTCWPVPKPLAYGDHDIYVEENWEENIFTMIIYKGWGGDIMWGGYRSKLVWCVFRLPWDAVIVVSSLITLTKPNWTSRRRSTSTLSIWPNRICVCVYIFIYTVFIQFLYAV